MWLRHNLCVLLPKISEKLGGLPPFFGFRALEGPPFLGNFPLMRGCFFQLQVGFLTIFDVRLTPAVDKRQKC